MTFRTKDGQPVTVTLEGSLGLLALGYRGVMAWRQARRDAVLAQAPARPQPESAVLSTPTNDAP